MPDANEVPDQPRQGLDDGAEPEALALTPSDRIAGGASGSRVRFSGVDASDDELSASPNGREFTPNGADMFEDPSIEGAPGPASDWEATDWPRLSKEVARASRLCAIFIAGAMLIFWPVLTAVGHYSVLGSLRGWNLIAAYPTWAVIITIIAPVMIYILGYIVSRQMLMMSAADALVDSARRLTEPERSAVFNVRTVGAAVRSQIDAVNTGIDDSLIRLASVEAMIRQHVEAIETAGMAMEGGASGALDRVAKERATLMKLTEQLNARADDFAVAIAEKAQASIDSFNENNEVAEEAERRLEERLGRLEQIAERALTSFESLCGALLGAEDRAGSAAAAIEGHAEDTKRATAAMNVVANEAAEAAARNALNVGRFAERASEEAIQASAAAIETSRESAERAAQEAVDIAARESGRIADAIVAAVDGVKSATDASMQAVGEDAARAIDAATQLTGAAETTAKAAREATAEVRAASAAAKASAGEALEASERAASQVQNRNQELASAQAALQKENERLESLIDEQRQRADRLADTIARQTERLSRLAEVQLREQEAAARMAEADAARQALANAPSSAGAPKGFLPPGLVGKPQGPASGATKGAMFQSTDAEPTRKSPAKESAPKEKVSWRDILNATDEAEPLDLGAAQRADAVEGSPRAPANGDSGSHSGDAANDEDGPDAVAVIHRLQNFTLNLDRRLYGDPPERLLARFDDGDRNLFANRLLRLDEGDVKRRIRTESDRDKAFAAAIQDFLHGFESLLEEATASDTADDDLEAYLSSPLGRVYLLIGATVGYFA
ncbi:MAG: hypothetical protein AAFX08_12360 [Pseudomonadota bacterium]